MSFQSANNIGQRPFFDARQPLGIGRVCIPDNKDRDDYVLECLQEKKVSILVPQGGGMYHNCFVPINIIQDVKFPAVKGAYGSYVSYFIEPKQSNVFIMAVYEPELNGDAGENSVFMQKEHDGNRVTLSLDAKESSISLLLNTEGPNMMLIQSLSESLQAYLKINIQGYIEQLANTIILKSTNSINLSSESNEQNEGSHVYIGTGTVEFDADKIIFNSGEEPALLGAKVDQFLNDLIDEIGNITITTPAGQMRILNRDKVTEFKNKIHSLLSQNFYLD